MQHVSHFLRDFFSTLSMPALAATGLAWMMLCSVAMLIAVFNKNRPKHR
jgi:cbb3-type cytochrome oxidase subunit 3